MNPIGSKSQPVFIDEHGAAQPCDGSMHSHTNLSTLNSITPELLSGIGGSGGGGVIDGTILRGPIQLKGSDADETGKILSYIAENDCLLTIHTSIDWSGGSEELKCYISTIDDDHYIGSDCDKQADVTDKPVPLAQIPVKRGTQLFFVASGVIPAGHVCATLSEYKLVSTDVPSSGGGSGSGGSGGVIDGTLFKDPSEITVPASSKLVSYMVENDCLLYIETDGTDISIFGYDAGGAYLGIYVNGSPVGRIIDTYSEIDVKDWQSVHIPVKKGSLVEIKNAIANRQLFTSDAKITFREYKLHALSASSTSSSTVSNGACVPNYDAYDPAKHDVPGSTFFNRGNLYDRTIKKSDYPGLLYFTAPEDCFFFPFVYTDTTTAETCSVYVGESANSTELCRVFLSDVSNYAQGYGYMIPMKKGQICAGICTNGSGAGYDYSFWLPMQSLAPQIAMPDYKATPTTVTNGWTATANGWLSLYDPAPSTGNVVYIGETVVYQNSDPGGDSDHLVWIPISKGETVTYSGDGNDIKFYPCKSVPQQSEKEDILNLLYPVGSIYLDGSNGSVCPLKAVIPGSDWQEVGTKLLTGGSTVPVVGNGSQIHVKKLSSGADYHIEGIGSGAVTGYIGNTSLGTGAIGLTEDPTKSGLVADLGSATGITVKIWQRIV